jgi:hypothetical protein
MVVMIESKKRWRERKREKESARQRREIRHFLKHLSVPVSG